MSKNIYLDNLVNFSSNTYSNSYQSFINLAKIDINKEISKLKSNNSINEKGVFIQYNYIELATLMDFKYNELVLVYPISFNIENDNIELYNFLNALLLVLNKDYFNQTNNIKKKYLDSLNEQLEKKIKIVNYNFNDKVFENVISIININLIILNYSNDTKIKIYKNNNNMTNKYIIVYKINNNYLPVCDFNTKYYIESSNFIKYLQEEYDKFKKEINNEKTNNEKTNNEKTNNEEINNEEINNEEINNEEINNEEINNEEINNEEINNEEINNEEINNEEINNEEINNEETKINKNDFYDEFQTVEDYTLHVSEAVDNKQNKELNSDNKKKKKNDKNIFITNKVDKKKEEIIDNNKEDESVFNKTEIISKEEIIKIHNSFKSTTKLEDIQNLCLKINIPIFAGSTKEGKPKNRTKTELLDEIKKYIS
jgi:hypothetical protein